jgi:hypothetical protein
MILKHLIVINLKMIKICLSKNIPVVRIIDSVGQFYLASLVVFVNSIETCFDTEYYVIFRCIINLFFRYY